MKIKPPPYTADDDQILKDNWRKATSYADMSRMMEHPRTEGAIKMRAVALKLGWRREGSNLDKPVYERLVLTPWPADMPRFQDNPVAAAAPCNLTLAIRVGALGR